MNKRDALLTWTTLIAAVVLSLPGMSCGTGSVSTRGVMSESEALDTAHQWAAALGKADIAGLEDLLHDDYMHIHATSMVESKAQFIGALKEGGRKYDPFTIEESKVRVFGNAAVVTGRFAVKATMRERVVERVNRFGLVVVRTPRGVKIASFQATSIPDAK